MLNKFDEFQVATGTPKSIQDLSSETLEIVRSYQGKFSWFSVILQTVVLIIYTTAIVLGVMGDIPIWVGFIITTICAYYTLGPLHDAMHGSVSGKGGTLEKLYWFDNVFAWISSIPLNMPFSAYRMLHFMHHAHVNNADRDPDYYLNAGSWQKAVWSCIKRRIIIILTMNRGGSKSTLKPSPALKRAKISAILLNYGSLAFLVIAAVYGFFVEAFFLWYLPSKVATLLLEMFFGYLPHVPFDSEDPFGQSSINTFFGSTILLFGHDYHAIHHLFPRVPFSKYKEVYQRVGEDLVKNGLRVNNY